MSDDEHPPTSKKPRVEGASGKAPVSVPGTDGLKALIRETLLDVLKEQGGEAAQGMSGGQTSAASGESVVPGGT